MKRTDTTTPGDPAVAGANPAGRGRLTVSEPDYGALYSSECQGGFYGADYYKPPLSDVESAIIYDDNEDKRVTAAMLVAAFGPRRAMEAGCATGLLVKALRGAGVDAWGFDFSKWCVDNAHPAVKEQVVRGDILDSETFAGRPACDLVLTLDILEHLPPDKLPAALDNLTGLMAPGAVLFTVIPAYGPNAFGPELYPLTYEEWRRDAAAGRPFRNIPLDDHGRPHLGHLTHATIGWWEMAMAEAGLRRLGEVERLLHRRFDDRLEFARRSFFAFAWTGKGRGAAGSGLGGRSPRPRSINLREFSRRLGILPDPVREIEKRLLERIAAVPGLPRGFYEWELWGDRWVRWTGLEAWDLIETRGRAELRLKAVCHHPDIEASPVRATFQIDDGPAATIEFRDHDWHEVELEIPRESAFCGLKVSCSRTWVPDTSVPESRRRSLGLGLRLP